MRAKRCTRLARRVGRRVSALVGAVVLCPSFASLAFALSSATPGAPLDAESQACQGCHAIKDWEINDPVTGHVAHLSIDSEAYAQSSHASVPCRSCHAWGYGEIPHRGSSGHPIYECVFCHEKDLGLQHLLLSQRKADLRSSVHSSTEAGPMDCHSCHDPHTFRLVNDSDDPLLRIRRSNAICSRCHSADTNSRDRFAQQDATPFHALFPHFANHLRKVKCVVCHTDRENYTHKTQHLILARDSSLGKCERCHTPGSTVLDVIYGGQTLGTEAGRADLGSNAYVIGSLRSPRLERLSVVGFAAICLAIFSHALARAVYAIRRRRRNGH